MKTRNNAAVTAYADHEVHTPSNHKLRKAVSQRPLAAGDDPVRRAERALAALSSEFAVWMETECATLAKARDMMKDVGPTAEIRNALFRAAHDIKGEAATFGFPACAAAADSLCHLIEGTPDPARLPVELVDQHVSAIRAIIREYERSDAVDLANRLTQRLREVTDEFLGRAKHIRPSVPAPSIVPK
jgi:HPt (histidine-containing phosphotransfer) domain-containing protein